MYIPPLSPLRLPLIALALAACGPPPSPGPTEAEEAARRAFEAATARLDAGEVEAGEAQLLALVHEAPQGPYADAARYHLARLTLPRDPALASRQLLGLAPRLPAPLGAKATLYGAIGAARAGRCAQAEGPLAAALPTLEGAEAVDARLALARCTRPLLHVEAALRLGLGDREAEARAILAALPPPQQAAARAGPLAALLTPTPPPTTTPTTPSPPTTTPTLGVLLPLSGPLAPMGRALKGVAPLAAAPRVKGGARLIFHEIDDAARLDGILRALAEEGAFGAVGLFDRAQALAAAKAAREINLPLIMLTLEDRALGAPGPVWRALHTPPLVARTAAGGGLERGGKVAAVVRPDRRFAARLEAWFSEAWRGGGGRVIQGISWPPEKPDWPSVARRVKALEADTLFIPCDAEDAAQLMSHLAAQKIWSRGLKPRFKGDAVREIVVLGISEWYTPQLLQRARRYLEGALIPAPFLAETPRGARFSALIREALSREASAFDALLYDALLALTQAATRSSDGGAVERLRRVEAVEAGVTSGLNFTRPEALGGLYLVEVYQGQFIPMR